MGDEPIMVSGVISDAELEKEMLRIDTTNESGSGGGERRERGEDGQQQADDIVPCLVYTYARTYDSQHAPTP